MLHTIIFIIFLLLILVGTVGIIIPIFPAIPYMFLVSIIFGLVNRFKELTLKEIIILGVIAIVSVVVDYLSGVVGARYAGASKKAVFYGFIGMILGTILFPPFGGIPGIFLGVLAAEIIRHGNTERAVKAATGGLIGSVAGMAINLVLAILFFVLFIVFALK